MADEEQIVEPHWIRNQDGVFESYTDYVRANWTSLTFRVRCGQIVPNPEAQPASALWVVQENVALTMPWFTAKALHQILTTLIQRYESKNGEIKLPELPDTADPG